MTPKEKAKRMYDKFIEFTPAEDGIEHNHTIGCCLIAVNEIISFVPYENYKETISPYDGAELSVQYWEEVKDEIEKL
jgi:hypothetical protein